MYNEFYSYEEPTWKVYGQNEDGLTVLDEADCKSDANYLAREYIDEYGYDDFSRIFVGQ